MVLLRNMYRQFVETGEDLSITNSNENKLNLYYTIFIL